ncbi:MAG: Ig-like domain-containing protein [Eubacterium sp.]|nr:Ig-like domain-containing protein [Eubacterium sp.]
MKMKHFAKLFLSLLFIIAFSLTFSTFGVRTYAAAKVKLSRTKMTMSVGDSQKLKINGSSKKVTWTSSNKNIAKVSSKGSVKALKAGKVTITAKVAGKKLKCKVTIYDTIGTYFGIWNVNWDPSPAGKKLTEAEAAEVRYAINRLFDRSYIALKIIPYGVKPATTFVSMGIMEPDGGQFYKHAGQKNAGYYSAKAQKSAAMKILKKYYKVSGGKITNFPKLEYAYNNEGDVHGNVGKYLQSKAQEVGIDMTLKAYDWESFQKVLAGGQFIFARMGWAADKNDALNFLETYASTKRNENYSGLGTGKHASKSVYKVKLKGIGKHKDLKGNWKQTYKKLIAKIRKEKNAAVRNQLLHKAEDLLMETGCICPFYYYQ